MHVVGDHQQTAQTHAMEGNNMLVMQHAPMLQHASDMSLMHHPDMHECDSNSNASHATSISSQHGLNRKQQHGKTPMKFVDETVNVRKKIKKKQDESCFKRSKLRKSLSNETFLENYFEYDNINGTNQLKKFKLIECSQSKIVTSEIIPNSNVHSMHVKTSESKTLDDGSTSHHVGCSQAHAPVSNSNVLESEQNNESNDNTNLLLALLYVLTADSQTQNVSI